jgi:hypothetical protein
MSKLGKRLIAAAKSADEWSAVRISPDMWNVYHGDDFSGYIHKTADGWRVDMQRQSRPRPNRPQRTHGARGPPVRSHDVQCVHGWRAL